MTAIVLLCTAVGMIAAILLMGLRLAGATRMWPAALLIVTAPLEVYRTASGAGLNMSLFRLALLVGVVALCTDLIRGRRRLGGKLAVPLVIYGAFVAWQVISLLFVTPAHSLGYRFLGQYAGGLLAAFIIGCYVERKDLRAIAALCAGAAVLPLLAAAFRVFSVANGGTGDLPGLGLLPLDHSIEAARKSGSYLLDGTQRLNATFSDPNHFGFYIASVLLIGAGAALSLRSHDRAGRRRAGISYVLLTMSTVVAIVGTYSRSSWLLACVGALALAALLGPTFWTRRRMLAVSAVGLLLLAAASPVLASRLNTSERGNVQSDQVHERTMSIALELVAHHPLLGVGLGDYGRHAAQPALVSSAHSTYLTVAAELGLLGVMLLLAAIATTAIAAVKSAWRAAQRDRALVSALAAAYVGLATANIFYEVWMDDFQWVLFGIVLAVTSQRRISVRAIPLTERRDGGNAHPDRPSELVIC